MITKIDKVVTYLKRLPPINSTNKWSGEVTGQIALYFHYPNAYGQKNYQDGDLPRGVLNNNFQRSLNEVVLWVHVKIKSLYLHLQKIYRYQTRQGTDLLLESPTL